MNTAQNNEVDFFKAIEQLRQDKTTLLIGLNSIMGVAAISRNEEILKIVKDTLYKLHNPTKLCTS